MSTKSEWVARIIYETWAREPGYAPWRDGGKALKQDDARAVASYILREIEDTRRWFWTGFICGSFVMTTFATIAIGYLNG